MFIARITRQKDDKVVKDEIRMDDLSELFGMLEIYCAEDILEIHITKQEDK